MCAHGRVRLVAQIRHYQTTGGRNACAVLSSQSATISFESVIVSRLSFRAAADSAAASLSNADFHSVRLPLAAAARWRAISSAALACGDNR